MKRPIITRGLIVEMPMARFERQIGQGFAARVGDSVWYRFPAVFDPRALWMHFGRVADATVEQIEAGIVRLRVLLKADGK